eukprot:TRINITY_DN25040_c0_g1_i1.p1 TRINITY_DN25040_c0_g1~~TRINITY_DN25040_c0_g1_i1.p1  ORF type:complete len:1188 (-),score=283.73 TRINITY_DN25040_c0_g1_i1:91-3609(-)
MDKVLLKFLKTEIEYFFKDFKQEDLNTNLFKGNLELTNLRLNTDVLQDALSPIVPYIQVDSAIVEKFKLRVPFSSIKSKATEVWISRIDIKCSEPVDFEEFQNSIKKTAETKQKEVVKTGKYEYTLVDRVLDGVQVTIDHIHVSMALLGRYKHARPGNWTPHILDVNIYDVQVYSVDEKWRKVGIQETRAYTHGKPHVWHFKESTFKLSVKLLPPKDASGSSIPLDPVPILDRLSVKFRLTQQRLNINETIGTEMTLIIGDAKMSFTPSQIGHLIFWIDALSSAAFRHDVPKQADKPVVPVTLERPNTLFTIVLDKLNIQFRDRDRPTDKHIQFELTELQINRVLRSDRPNETITRILLSQINLVNLKLDTTMMQLYFTDPNKKDGKHLYLPIPKEVRLHPEAVPEPQVLRYCQVITVRFPEPNPPTPAFEYNVNADGFELVVERDGFENLAIFLLQANLVNSNRTKPSIEDYKGTALSEAEIQSQIQGEAPTTEVDVVKKADGEEFFEMDLLANAISLISLDCKIQEFSIKVPTPGGGAKPYLELRFDGVSLIGSPESAPAVYKRDFLDIKSNNGTCLVMPHDFYFQKFIQEKGEIPKEYTFKFNAAMKSLAINMYEKQGAPREAVCSIMNIYSFCKIYSRARHIPNRLTIPQVESSVVASEVAVRLVQKHHHLLVDFLSEHFLYGATSIVKRMLEEEIKSLAVEERKFARAQEDPNKKKKFLRLPSYMVSSAIDKLTISFIDDGLRDVLNLKIDSTECIIEKHDDRQIIIARIGDLRLHSVFPELEKSIIWVSKSNLKNMAQFRTEWRKLNEGELAVPSRKGDAVITDADTRSYIIGDLAGIRVNFDFFNIYNIEEYLSDVLGETLILLDKTQHSHYWWKISRYIDILYVAGIPSEANNYWRSLREIKLFLEQFSDLFNDITWDLSISDIRVSFGDDLLKVEPFSMQQLRIYRETQDPEDHVTFLLKQVKGSLWTTQENVTKERVLCEPVDTICKFHRKKKVDWSPSSGTSPWEQNALFESHPSPRISITHEDFTLMGNLFDRHIPRIVKFINELMEHADKAEQRRTARSSVIFDEDVLDEARGTAARAYSVETVKAMKKDLEKTKKELDDALQVQSDIATKFAEMQVAFHDLQQKCDSFEKKAIDGEIGMMEMSKKLMEVQMKLANAKF